MLTEFTKGITFTSTVLATLKFERTAYQGESFAFIGFPQYLIQLLYSSAFLKSTLKGIFYEFPNHDLR